MNKAANLLKEMRISHLGKVFAACLSDLMSTNKDIYYLDCDLAGALGTTSLMESHSKQAINCGIMEANMIGMAAGMSLKGKIPFTHTFGTFAARRVADQVFLSGCYNDANIKMIGSDPGISAQTNGGTHMPFEDIGVFRSFPNITILDINDEVLLKKLLPEIVATHGIMYIRMPRKNSECYYDTNNEFEIGKAKLLREGSDVTIIASGVEVFAALKAAEELQTRGIDARVVDMFTIKPIDAAMVIECASKTGAIVTAENHNIIGGLGSAVAEVLSENKPCVMKRIGVNEMFGEVGTSEYLAQKFGMTSDDIVDACLNVIQRKEK